MSKDIPNPYDIQKDLKEFLSKKYGEQVVVDNPDIEGAKEGVQTEDKSKKSLDFNLKPIELEQYLKNYIVGQDEAIAVIATKICTHFNRMSFEEKNPEHEKILGNIKGNVLLIGPTGVGKTYIIKLIADKLGVPFVKGDATKFTETGYVGGDVEDLVRELVRETNGDIHLAEFGIIYLDEIDKIASSTNTYGPDVSRTGVQRNLLKVMEESEVDLKNPMDIASQMEAVMQAQRTGKVERKKINTRNILFIMSGAFQDLVNIIKKRLNTQPLGFITKETVNYTSDSNWLRHVNRQDLIEFGFESEFVGRLPVFSILNELTEDGLYEILKNPKSSVILGKKRDFLAYDINLEFTDSALRLISKEAIKDKIGARSLVSVCEKILIRFEKFLPSTRIKKLNVTEELITNPDQILKHLLAEDAVLHIADDFLKEHGIALNFTESAIEHISSIVDMSSTTPYKFLHKILKNYEYGLKLLGLSEFNIDKDLIDNWQEYLDNLIKKAYESNNKKKMS